MRNKEIFESDEEIKEELLHASREHGRQELRNRLAVLELPRSSKRYLRLWYSAAAMIIVLIIAVFLMQPPSSKRLYTDFYSKLPNKVAAITRGDAGIDVLRSIMLAYEGEEYDGLVNQIKEEENDFPQLSIYKAMVLLEEEKFDQAIITLLPLYKNKKYHFNEDAKWYLALAYIRVEEKEKAKLILKELISSSSKFRTRAEIVIRKL